MAEPFSNCIDCQIFYFCEAHRGIGEGLSNRWIRQYRQKLEKLIDSNNCAMFNFLPMSSQSGVESPKITINNYILNVFLRAADRFFDKDFDRYTFIQFRLQLRITQHIVASLGEIGLESLAVDL